MHSCKEGKLQTAPTIPGFVTDRSLFSTPWPLEFFLFFYRLFTYKCTVEHYFPFSGRLLFHEFFVDRNSRTEKNKKANDVRTIVLAGTSIIPRSFRRIF